MAEWYLRLVENIVGKNHVVDVVGEEPSRETIIFRPIITISRDPGSGGKPVAQKIAEKLKYKFYNKSLIADVAKSAKAREAIIKEIDEKQRTLIEDLVHNSLNPEYISEAKYIKNLSKVVLMLNQRGKAVILGRGTNFMVPAAYAYRVRITAPYRVCVARAVRYEGVPYGRAREIINKVMAERAGFVQQYFGKDITNPKYYDLTINTAYMSIDDTVDLILAGFKRKFPKA